MILMGFCAGANVGAEGREGRSRGVEGRDVGVEGRSRGGGRS